MPFVRKSYVLATAVLVFLTFSLFSNLPPAADVDATEFYSSPPKKNVYKPHWRRRPEKYPVKTYVQLPTAAPEPIPQIQHNFSSESWFAQRKRTKRQAAVKEAFEHAWNGYKKHAWLHDEVSPLSGDHCDTFAGWAATLVDSLDSLIIMGMTDEFEKALAALDQIDFTTTDANHVMQINVFETTIRYLGGLMAANDLTNGKYPILLQKAVEVGDFLYGAFDTRNRMPQSRWQWTR